MKITVNTNLAVIIADLIKQGDNIDGETLEYIIKELGMKDQILRQLVLQSDFSEIELLLEEKRQIEKIPQFPLGVPPQITSAFMGMDCFGVTHLHPVTEKGVKNLSKEDKCAIYENMMEVYYTDEVFRGWFLREMGEYYKGLL